MTPFPMDCSTRITSPEGEVWVFEDGVPATEVNKAIPNKIKKRLLDMMIVAFAELLRTSLKERPERLNFEIDGWTVTLWREEP